MCYEKLRNVLYNPCEYQSLPPQNGDLRFERRFGNLLIAKAFNGDALFFERKLHIVRSYLDSCPLLMI